jgi:hypothetical protein
MRRSPHYEPIVLCRITIWQVNDSFDGARFGGAAQDQGYSFWNDKAIHISERMTKAAAPGYISEVLAYEGGHPTFQKSGLKTKV